MTEQTMTCEEFESLLPDYLEDGALDTPVRDRADTHRLDCAVCAALVADLHALVRQANALPPLEPVHDLWNGIEERIAADVVALPVHHASHAARDTAMDASHAAHRAWPAHRLALAASLLVMATGGIPWTVASRRPVLVIPAGPATAVAPNRTPASAAANKPSIDETYDREIGALRKIVDERRADLDSATIGILEKNLLVIDKAIRESRDALAKDPANAFLNESLSRAYDTKLQLLRGVAMIPARS
jgi:hypothetical protein